MRYRLIPTRARRINSDGTTGWYQVRHVFGLDEAMVAAREWFEETQVPVLVCEASEEDRGVRVVECVGLPKGKRKR